MKPRDKLLAGLGLGAAALLCAYAARFIYAIIVAIFFTLSPEAQSQGNWWLANGLSTSIETALGNDAPATLANNCSPPMEGFAPAPECIFVRGTDGGPGCMRSNERDGGCNVVTLKGGLLRDQRVLDVITEASRQSCLYIGVGSRVRTVPGCQSPGPDWRLQARTAPLTICVIAEDADQSRLAFAIRNGEYIRDRWCENVWALRPADR
ncbi:MAG: hypothetical protein KF779_13975 [Hyphomonadaceae bacterium]|nr:hypothetical protein [Hyphomonadaceae bacterium]MCA8885470.1 hypothetical protein [Hyphomonadaceae bacterium]